MRTRLLTSMAATLLLVGVGSAAVAVTGVDGDGTSVADEAVPGDQDQLRLQDRDELCDPIGEGEPYRYGSTDSSTNVDPDRDRDQLRDGDRDPLRDQLRDDSCARDGDGLRDRDQDRDGTCLTGEMADGTAAQVGEQVRMQTREQVQTQEPTRSREEAGIQSRVQEESQHHSREQAGAPDARGQR